MNNKFAETLRKKREEKSMTKKDVAESFNWTPMYYGRYENGYLLPNKANYDRFAKFMGISVSELEELIIDATKNE
ncbi:MAG: helix-turn-helix transcriptional regulator [Acholeplasmatales bacterium]|nr:helix-turn-helix transcriptional regulator [Acholeplasmatales bacterium]